MDCMRLVHCVRNMIEGMILCIAILFFQILTFGSCFLASGFIAIAGAALIHYAWNLELPPFLVALAHGILIINLGGMHAVYMESALAPQLAHAMARHPIIVGVIPMVSSTLTSLYALYIMHLKFMAYSIYQLKHGLMPSNTLELVVNASINRGERIILPKTTMLLTNDKEEHMCWFLTAFAFVLYNAARAIYPAMKKHLVVLEIVHPRDQYYPRLVRTLFVLCQFGITLAYALPIFYSCLALSSLLPDAGLRFFYICIIGISTGFLVSFLEARDPFPRIRASPPLFTYERNIEARMLVLKYGLVPFVYVYFFEAPLKPQSSEETFNPQDPKIMLFSICTATLLLHVIKILSVLIYIPRITLQGQPIAENQLIEPGNGGVGRIFAVGVNRRNRPRRQRQHRRPNRQIDPEVPADDTTIYPNLPPDSNANTVNNNTGEVVITEMTSESLILSPTVTSDLNEVDTVIKVTSPNVSEKLSSQATQSTV